MKDMVPKATGNSRLLRSSIPADTTHDELVSMLRAGTFPFDFAGLNAAGISQQGTPLNKSTLLSDETVQKLGIPGSAADATVNDAFNALFSRDGFKTGDVHSTWRTDLGENWLLCNGDSFDKDTYQALAAITPDMPTMLELTRTMRLTTRTNAAQITSIAAHDDMLVALSSDGYIYVTHDVFKTTQEIQPTSKNGNNDVYIAANPYNRIFYANGYWIIFEQSGSGITALWECTDPMGAWTRHAFKNMTNIFVVHLEHLNGLYWAFGTAAAPTTPQSNCVCGSFFNFNITSFALTNIPMPAGTQYAMFVRTTQFTFVCVSDQNSAVVQARVRLLTTQNPATTWTTTGWLTAPEIPATKTYYKYGNSWYSANISKRYVNMCAAFIDGKIIGLCSPVYISDGAYYGFPEYYVIDDKDNSIHLYATTPQVPQAVPFNIHTYQMLKLTRARDRYFVYIFNNINIYAWRIENPEQLETYILNGFTAADSSAAALTKYTTDILLCGKSGTICRIPEYAVPLISLPQVYTYIKAKEA